MSPPPLAQHRLRYTICSLGAQFHAWDINNQGQVVGMRLPDGEGAGGRACLYEDGAWRDLDLPAGRGGLARAINDRGWIAGSMRLHNRDAHAFLYADGVVTDLGMLYGHKCVACGINDQGHVVGWSTAPVGSADINWEQVRHRRAFLYDSAAVRDLGTLGGRHSAAAAINNRGQVVGWAETADGVQHAFLHDAAGMHDLGLAPGGTRSEALAVNDADQVVGFAPPPGACFFAGSAPVALGTLPGDAGSVALGINAAGEVVGMAYGRLAQPGRWAWRERAFLWRAGAMFALLDLVAEPADWELVWPRAINDAGQIAGTGVYRGQRQAFLLTPVASAP